ncbi:MAG: hypothetical protein H6704_10735 [Myxococcales bacterium]|nr:hypothetical protein [Myxococcales bacterium]
MALQITVPLEHLRHPAVARATAALSMALHAAQAGGALDLAPPRDATPPPAPAVPPTSDAYRAFADGLPTRSRRFLDLLESRGTLTASEAKALLGLHSGKQLGGVTGAVSKWAPLRGVAVPFECTHFGRERGWRWLGA